MRSALALAVLCTLLAAPTAHAESPAFEDPSGDVQRRPEGSFTEPSLAGGADIVGFDLRVTATELAVSATLADEPSSEFPSSIIVRWELEVESRTVAVVSLGTLGGSFSGGSFRLPPASRLEATECGGVATLEGRVATVERIPVGCLGASFYGFDDFDVRVRVDTDYVPAEQPEGGSYHDGAPDGGAPSPPVPATRRSGPREGLRAAGGDRFATAVAISRLRTPAPDSDGAVYIASATEPADALAVGNSGQTTLLVPACGELPRVVAEELARLSPDEVTAVGGTAAVCDSILDEAAAVAGAERNRLAGANRFGTSAAVVDDTTFVCEDSADCPRTGDVYLTRGDAFADALAAAPLDAGPLLLVPSCGALPAEIRQAFDGREFPVDRIVVLGGKQAVCDEIVAQVRELLPDGPADAPVVRLAGGSRIETALAISKERFPAGAVEVALARGDAFPDALAGGSLPLGPVLLLPDPCTLPEAVAGEIERLNPTTVIALGGESAVCERVLESARS